MWLSWGCLADELAEIGGRTILRSAQVRVTELNQALAMPAAGSGGDLSSHDYQLGPGDVIKIEAPQVPEIQGLSVRIMGQGTVSLPLLWYTAAARATQDIWIRLACIRVRVTMTIVVGDPAEHRAGAAG